MTTSYYRDQVCSAIEATAILSATSYSWFGRPSESLPSRIKRSMTARTARNYLRTQLQNQLYSEFYIRGKVSPKLWNDEDERAAGTDFVDRLSAANTGTGCSEGGWGVVDVEDGTFAVQRHGLSLWVSLEDLEAPAGEPVARGAKVKLRLSKELRSVSPGYYFALGDRVEPHHDTAPMARLYWNLTKEIAAPFLREATLALNRANLFFRLKLLNDPGSYRRCDAAVLYISRCDYPLISAALRPVYALVGGRLKPMTPAFTKALAPGLGIAEDPGSSESFGQHRCRLLAEGLIRGYEQDARSLADRLQLVSDCFNEGGIDLGRPYQEANSPDIYTFAS